MLLAFFFAAAFRFTALSYQFEAVAEVPEGRTVTVQGIICKKGIRSEGYDWYLRKAEIIYWKDGAWEYVSAGRILLRTEEDVCPTGGMIRCAVEMRILETASNEGAFDEKQYYHSLGISSVLYADGDEFELISGSEHSFRELLFHLRLSLRSVFEETLNESDAGILSAMILGDKSLMAQDVKDLYSNAGISHILAVSGLHISVIGMSLYHFLRKRRVGFVPSGAVSGGGVLIFCLLSGMSVSAVRAGIMFGVFLGANILGRKYDTFLALLMSAGLCLAFNPFYLTNAGFLFSYSAVLGAAGIGSLGAAEKPDEETEEKGRSAPDKKGNTPAWSRLRLLAALPEKAGEKGRKIPREEEKPSFGDRLCSLAARSKKAEKKDGEESDNEKNGNPANCIRFLTGRLLKSAGQRLWMSLSILFMTLPLTAFFYYQIPLFSVLANLVVLPFTEYLLIFGILGGLAGLTPLPFSWIFFFPCHVILRLFEWLCRVLSIPAGGSLITGKPGAGWLVIYYFVLLWTILSIWPGRSGRASVLPDRLRIQAVMSASLKFFHSRFQPILNTVLKFLPTRIQSLLNRALQFLRRKFFMKFLKKIPGKEKTDSVRDSATRPGRRLLILPAVLLAAMMIQPSPRTFETVFLDVGQGDGIYISGGNGTHYFVDGGSSSESEVGRYQILPFLKYNRVRSIDVWFVTHADSDHVSGLLEVLEFGYRVEKIVIADTMPKDDAWGELKKAADAAGTEITEVSTGDSLSSGELTMAFYAAEGTQTYTAAAEEGEQEIDGDASDRNERSLVQLIEYRDLRILLTGDIAEEQEEWLTLQEGIGDVDVLKAAHHGSKYSNSKALLTAVCPEATVISCGEYNSYGHPHEEALERIEEAGSEIFETMESGQIRIFLRDGEPAVELYLGDP